MNDKNLDGKGETASLKNGVSPPQDLGELLEQRSILTENLLREPAEPSRYLERSKIYTQLGYPDLAAADAYNAITLIEKLLDPYDSDFGEDEDASDEEPARATSTVASTAQDERLVAVKLECFSILIQSLIDCGCLQDAYRFWVQARQEGAFEAHKELIAVEHHFVRKDSTNPDKASTIDISSLPNSGFVRREVYPWNNFEPDRTSPETVDAINQLLHEVAPDLEARSTTLPDLNDPSKASVQLGLFAKRTLSPGEPILKELSLLTATTTLHAPLCDACQRPLPSLTSPTPPIPCPSCNDTIFCSATCHDLAQALYHPALCTPDSSSDSPLSHLGITATDHAPLSTRSNSLYLLLLARVLAMSLTQNVHPLSLPCTKYLFGDFSPTPSPSIPNPQPSSSSPPKTLPFTFLHTLSLPSRLLALLLPRHTSPSPSPPPFTPLSIAHFDPWILQTLLSKFRAVASARQSTWDGAPEVAAVHPLWCLANHSCAPNVRWEWEGSVGFWVRGPEERVWKDRKDGGEGGKGEGGVIIREGEEVLNHYCDVGMGVGERREWARGALGGECRCVRCVWEEKEDGEVRGEGEGEGEGKRREGGVEQVG